MCAIRVTAGAALSPGCIERLSDHVVSGVPNPADDLINFSRIIGLHHHADSATRESKHQEGLT
ncbi:hypothetical protein DEDE109153_14825 [Deinococcus deserti]